MLLEKGADINMQGGFYGNALQAVSQGGYEKLVQMLLEKGADVNTHGGNIVTKWRCRDPIEFSSIPIFYTIRNNHPS